MPAGSEDLVLKISADTTAVAAGLAPMTTALDKLSAGADEADTQLGKLSNLSVKPAVDVSTMDKLKTSIDNAGDALDQLADPVTMSVRDQAIQRAQERIEELKDQVAEDVALGVDTKDALREISTLERTVNELQESPVEIPVEVDPDDADFAFESMAKLKRGVRSLTDAVLSAGDGIKALPDLVSAGVGSFTTLNASMSEFLEKQAAIGKGAGPLATRLGQVTGFLAGPWGLAIAGGITILGAMVGKMNEADEATKDFAKSLDYQTGAMDRNNRMKAATQLRDEGLLGKIQQLNLSTQDFVAALAGDQTALARVNQQMDALAANDAWNSFQSGQTNVGLTTQRVNILRDAFQELTGATSTEAAENKALAEAVDGVGASAQNTAGAVDDLATANTNAATSMSNHDRIWLDYSSRINDAQTALDKLVESLDLFNGRMATAEEATATYEEDVDALTTALEENGRTTRDHGKTLDVTTAKGRANQAVIIKTAKDIEDLRKARLDDMATSGETSSQIMADYRSQRAALIESAHQLGLSEKAAKEYVDRLLGVPSKAETDVYLKGADEAADQMEDLAKDRTATITVTLAIDKWSLNKARRLQQEIDAGNLGPGGTSAAPTPVPTPRAASTVFLQPRLFLDSHPIRAAMRSDVEATVSSTLASTRQRGRL